MRPSRGSGTYAIDADLRMTAVIGTVGILGIAVHIALIPLFAWLGIPWMAAFNVGSAAAWIVGWRANSRGHHDTAISLMTAEVILHTIAAVSALGWQAGFQYYLLGGIPFTLFNTRFRTSQIVGLAVIIALTFCTLYVITPQVRYVFPDPRLAHGMHLANAAISFAAVGLASFYFRHASLSAERALAELAATDVLTGVHNRRHMTELLEREHARALRSGHAFAVLLIDVDFFKQCNDRYGHDGGDAVLCAVTETLTTRLRRTDALGRWGGEEFIVLLPESDTAGASRIAESLRQAVEAHRTPFKGQEVAVTLTIGAALSRSREPLDAMLTRADHALYRGKHEGRNRVVLD